MTAPCPTGTSADPQGPERAPSWPLGCGPASARPGARPAATGLAPGGSQRRALLAFGAALALPGRAQAAPAAIVLPRDFGAHPEARIEWWYITGALDVPRVADAAAGKNHVTGCHRAPESGGQSLAVVASSSG